MSGLALYSFCMHGVIKFIICVCVCIYIYIYRERERERERESYIFFYIKLLLGILNYNFVYQLLNKPVSFSTRL